MFALVGAVFTLEPYNKTGVDVFNVSELTIRNKNGVEKCTLLSIVTLPET
jgi:hypothetical protein